MQAVTNANLADPRAAAVAPVKLAYRLAQAVFFLFVLLEVVTVSPFNPRASDALSRSEGSPIEAIAYVVLGGGALLVCVALRSGRPLLATPLSWAALLLYCCISLTWSLTPMAGTLRLGETIIMVIAIFALLSTLRPEDAVKLIAQALALVVVIDLASVFVLPIAVHRPGEPDPSLIGAWRGMHLHKNSAGAVAAIAAILFGLRLLKARTVFNAVILAVTVVFLIGTRSRTSIALAILAPIVAGATIYGMRRLSRWQFRTAVALVVIAVGAVVALAGSSLEELLQDPELLTGRVGLWQVLTPYMADHFLLGSGFGSFWRLGADSPIVRLTDGWGLLAGQAHNGFIDVQLTLGAIGVLLAAVAFVGKPLQLLTRGLPPQRLAYEFSFCLIVFALAQNIATETSFLVGNHPVFFFFTVGVGLAVAVQRPAGDPA